MKIMLLAAVALGAAGVGGICELCQTVAPEPVAIGRVEAPPAAMRVAAAETRTVRLRIEGMTCGGCAISARAVLERLQGVKKAEVVYSEKLAVVTYDPTMVTPERMITALKEKLKYTATLVEPKRK